MYLDYQTHSGVNFDNTGTNDQVDYLEAAIQAATAAGLRLWIPMGNYRLSRTLMVGDGTGSAHSTQHNIHIVGAGSTMFVGNIFAANQTRLFYSGSSTNNPIVCFNGPLTGLFVEGIAFDCQDNCSGVQFIQCHYAEPKFCSVVRYKNYAYDHVAWDSYPYGVGYGNCEIHQLFCAAFIPVSGADGIRLRGGQNPAPDTVPDTCRVFIQGGTYTYDGSTGTAGIRIAFADNNYIKCCVLPYLGSGGKSVVFEQQGNWPLMPCENTVDVKGPQNVGGTSGTGGNRVFVSTSDGQTTGPMTNIRLSYSDGREYDGADEFQLGGGDGVSPTLSSSTPADQATGVSGSANITLTFSESVQAGNGGNITIEDISTGSDTRTISIFDSQITFSGNTVTINPTTNLLDSTSYQVLIQPGVIKDLHGTSFAGISAGQLNFTTSGPDVTAPTLSSSTPTDSATSVSTNGNIVLNFSEPVQAGTGNIIITDLTDGSDTRTISITDGQVSISGSTVTINPTTDLEVSTSYEITMASGVIKDMSNNNFAGISSGQLNFTTGGSGSWHSVFTSSLSSTGGGDINGQCFRNEIPGSVFTNNYSKVRLTLQPDESYNAVFSGVYLGKKASSGDAWDFQTTPVQVTKSSSGTFTLTANSGSHVMDETIFSGVAGDAMIISMAWNGSTRSSTQSHTGFPLHLKTSGGAADVATVNASGFSTIGQGVVLIKEIEVWY